MTSEKRIKLLHNLLLKCVEHSRKTQTRNPRVSAALKPGFGVWQNGRVCLGPVQNLGFNS